MIYFMAIYIGGEVSTLTSNLQVHQIGLHDRSKEILFLTFREKHMFSVAIFFFQAQISTCLQVVGGEILQGPK